MALSTQMGKSTMLISDLEKMEKQIDGLLEKLKPQSQE
jgi:hypothetical protein